jgi:pyrimidine-nucleoside phosphorylase
MIKRDTEMSFLPAELIKRKRDGKPHSPEEIQFLVQEYSAGRIPDYQMSAWLMSVFFRGMTGEETHALTQAMLHSGLVIDLQHLNSKKVDKHSTGGVGDKTSLILAPIVAACGVSVPMISGRGLGHTGGTLDKLESIPGFNTRLDEATFANLIGQHGLCFIGQTEKICPADKKLYALRDVTGTVESIPLICASIMSKKLAEGIDSLVLDVKFGSGAFMKTLATAETLAKNLMEIGERGGKKVTSLLTSMEQPLGAFIGNSLEVQECLSILQNQRSHEWEDTRKLSLELSAHMILLGEKATSIEAARTLAEEALSSGRALRKFREICRAQGGRLDELPVGKPMGEVQATRSGYISSFDTEGVGYAGLVLGAGRKVSTDEIEVTAGFKLHKKLGARVEKGEPVFSIYGKYREKFPEAQERLLRSFTLSEKEITPPPLIEKTLLGKN